jgi:hypothetical protein
MSEAYKEGVMSYLNGGSYKDNPYSPENDYSKWDSWCLGWVYESLKRSAL